MYLFDMDEVQLLDGHGLMRKLEKKGVITSRNPYSELISILLEIQREDIVCIISSLAPEACSCVPLDERFSGNQQLLQMKKRCLVLKKDEYCHCMGELKVVINCGISRQSRFSDFFDQVFSELVKQPDMPTLDCITLEILRESLHPLSQFWKSWPNIMGQFQCTCSRFKLKHSIEHCHDFYRAFCDCLNMDWASRMRAQVERFRHNSIHPIGQLARKAHTILDDVSSELLGRESSLDIATTSVKDAMFTIESVNYTARYMIPMFKWLVHLIYAIGSDRTAGMEIDGISEKLASIVLDHKVELHQNWKALSSLLGDHLSSQVENLIPASSTKASNSQLESDTEREMDYDVYSALTETVGLVWYTALIILRGVSTKRIHHLSDECIQLILKRIQEFLNRQKDKLTHTYLSLSKQMATCMQWEVQTFKARYKSLIFQLTGGTPESANLIDWFFNPAADV